MFMVESTSMFASSRSEHVFVALAMLAAFDVSVCEFID